MIQFWRHIAGSRVMGALLSALGAFALSSAANAADVAPDLIRRVELLWEPDRQAQSYEFELSVSPEFSENLYTEKLQETKFMVDLLPGAYYYRVRSVDIQGRPGRWTAIQELNINARPPVLIWPLDGTNFEGNLPDTGIGLTWRSSGPGVRYLIEIKSQDQAGNWDKTVVKQEISDTDFPFFPQLPGRYQWSVHTLGPGGDEAGAPWEFNVEGVFPRGAAPGSARIVRYVPPFWRGHWTAFLRYGQAQLDYSIVDQDFRASGAFTGLTGFAAVTLNYEWHDPIFLSHRKTVDSKGKEAIDRTMPIGIPWFETEYQLDRQTVLFESVVLPRWTARAGIWIDQIGGLFLPTLRFGPVAEYGRREIAFYQPLSSVKAVRSNSTRNHAGIGPAIEWKPRSYLTFGAAAKFMFESGGESGIFPKGGVYDVRNRAGTLQDSRGFEASGSTTMSLGRRIQVQGRMKYEKSELNWKGKFPTQSGDPDTHVGISHLSFDLSVGIKF